MQEVAPYYQNTLIGLTAWNSEQQAYYLVPFAQVSSFLSQLSEQVTVSDEFVKAAFEFMVDYDPDNEIVLLTLNEDLLTVSVVSKYEPPTKESLAEQINWPLAKVQTFCYLENTGVQPKDICNVLKITSEEYDQALGLIIA